MKKENMALYRKYRPETFSDVVGQDHIIKTLESSIEKGEIVHSYLFSGSRGIGKTSVARIFARAIGTSENDINEIDAASNRKIDDARELRDTVSSLPFESPYKVYIIDEVHMLTREAFNALLKTLEEPPAHVIFILATTELHKLPDTIVSRCQTINFRRPTLATIKEHLISVAKKEKMDIDPEAAYLLSLIADGSFRDALGILQKISSSVSSSKITAKDVEEITGAPSTELVNGVVSSIVKKDADKGIEIFRKVQVENYDVKLFFERVIQKIRFVLILKNSPRSGGYVKKELSEDEYKFVESLSKDKDFVFSLDDLKLFLDALDLCQMSAIKIFPLETAFLDVIKKDQ